MQLSIWSISSLSIPFKDACAMIFQYGCYLLHGFPSLRSSDQSTLLRSLCSGRNRPSPVEDGTELRAPWGTGPSRVSGFSGKSRELFRTLPRYTSDKLKGGDTESIVSSVWWKTHSLCFPIGSIHSDQQQTNGFSLQSS